MLLNPSSLLKRNGKYYAAHFKNVFISQLDYFSRTLSEKLIPQFADVEGEAEELAEREYKRLGEFPATDDGIDLADLAEEARDAAIDYFVSMTRMKQAVLNVFGAGLYHLFEQQLKSFYTRELGEFKDSVDLKKIMAVFNDTGVDVQQFRNWKTLEELRLVANTIKHGEGRSAKQLRKVSSSLFENPLLGESFPQQSNQIIFQPLVGEDIYVRLEDFNRYISAVKGFWEQLSFELERL